MDCTLVVRSSDSIRQWEVDDWTVLAVIASLGVEPQREAELIRAVERYGVEHRLEYRGQKLSDLPRFSPEQAWCVVDLIGHSIVGGGELEMPSPCAVFEKTEGDPPGGSSRVWINVPADWIIERADDQWRELVESRYQAGLRRNRRDVRDVLFGRALLEHLASGVLEAVQQGAPSSSKDNLRLTRAIHANWLMTARSELDGVTPREVLLEHRESIDHELFQRTQQWTSEGKPPPPLDENSDAYRYGGFGIIQISFYFDMIRSLLAEAWKRVEENPSLTVGELIEQLAQYRERWLDTPNEEMMDTLTPRQWMHAERSRMPVTSEDSMIDCDCPICQAQAEGQFGTGFIMFDGHHLELEDEFAFSTIKNREEWEGTQWDVPEPEMDLPQQEPADDVDVEEEELAAPVWQSSFVDWDGPPTLADPLAEAAMRIGFCLCEIIADLKQRPDGRTHLLRLNDAYREFRRSPSSELARQAAQQLCKELEETAAAHPELMSKSSDLQSRIDEVLRSLDHHPSP